MFVEAFSAGELNNEAALPEIQIEWKRSFFVIYCFDNYLLIFCFSSLLIQSCPGSDAKLGILLLKIYLIGWRYGSEEEIALLTQQPWV